MFNSKYIESQYRITSSAASFVTGTVSVLPMGIGIMLGGVIITLLKPKPRLLLIFVFLLESVSIYTVAASMFFGADPINLDGQLTTSQK